MKKYSKNNDMPTREAIIGLGESSVRKNYYPELQEKIYTLEKMSSRNNTLIMAIPDLLLVSDTNGYISPFATSSREEATLVLSVIREEYIHSKLKTEIEEVLNTQEPRSFDFELNLSGENKFSENIEKIFAQAAIKLGEHLKLETHTIDQITLLTKFHDIGKVGIPDDILKKPGALDEKEWKIMKTHTTIGQRISSVSAELKPISDLILLHHEKWDGSGYPMGLSGDAIPIECRILALVDAFDAMTNDRPYRKALSFKEAISEIIKCKGSHFDPELVDIFLEILSNK